MLPPPLSRLSNRIKKSICEREAEHDYISNHKRKAAMNERYVEYSFALRALGEAGAATVLDVGTGKTAWPHLLQTCGFTVTAIDNIKDYWDDGMWNRHWYIINDDIRATKLTDKFDAITCISVLEHIADHEIAIRNMFHLLRFGGRLILTIPFNASTYHPNVYKDPRASYGNNFTYIGQCFSDTQLKKWIHANSAELILEELYEAFTGQLWTFGSRKLPLLLSKRGEPHQLGCFILENRQG